LKLSASFVFKFSYFLKLGTIEAVLQRGEKLDDLVSKSEDLSLKSKIFHKTVKRPCCSYMA
jgi:hypothetical protein